MKAIRNDSEQYIQVQRDAEDILKTFGILNPPVQISLIKKVFPNSKFYLANFDESAWGFAYPSEEGKWIVLIKRDLSENAKRFTAFHEFYHTLNSEVGYNRDTINGRFQESLANHFAACILMPARWFRKYWKLTNGNVVNMADIFKVSTEAIEIRAKKLEHYLAANY